MRLTFKHSKTLCYFAVLTVILMNSCEKDSTKVTASKIEILSGNNQPSQPAKKQAEPLKVKVTDVNGNGMNGIEVEWSIKSGAGILSTTKSKTNSEGVAEVEWTVGTTETQTVEAIVRKPDGSMASGAPVTFTATASILGKWILTSHAGVPYSGTSNYLSFESKNIYYVGFNSESGAGTYTITNNKIIFRLTSGDDDLTDGDTYTIAKLTFTELILSESSAHIFRR